MAIRVYKAKNGGALAGTAGSDTFVVDLDRLRKKSVEITDTGGADDRLVILDADGKWDAKFVVSAADGLVWNGVGVGRITLPLNAAGASKIESIHWGRSADDIALSLRVVTDLVPTTGGGILIAGTHGDDVITAPNDAGSGSLIYGGRGDDRITAGSHEDYTVYGGDGADVIVTIGPARGVFYGQIGKDILFGCSGADQLFGGAGADNLSGQGGKDVLAGGRKGDTLDGGDGADKLIGGKGGDLLRGGLGNDSLSGNRGKDTLIGGDGADVFVFTMGQREGRDIIPDFEDGLDLIQFKGGAFGDIKITPAGPEGTDTKISFAGGTRIILPDQDHSDIAAADFLF